MNRIVFVGGLFLALAALVLGAAMQVFPDVREYAEAASNPYTIVSVVLFAAGVVVLASIYCGRTDDVIGQYNRLVEEWKKLNEDYEGLLNDFVALQGDCQDKFDRLTGRLKHYRHVYGDTNPVHALLLMASRAVRAICSQRHSPDGQPLDGRLPQLVRLWVQSVLCIDSIRAKEGAAPSNERILAVEILSTLDDALRPNVAPHITANASTELGSKDARQVMVISPTALGTDDEGFLVIPPGVSLRGPRNLNLVADDDGDGMVILPSR